VFGLGCGRDRSSSRPAPPASSAPATAARAVGNPAPTAGAYAPKIDPAAFATQVDHPFFPLRPGMRWVYESGGDEPERIVVEVLSETRQVMGVTCVVVRDVVHVKGELHEETLDWYAQDRDGNVWYFGEDTKAYENGKVSTAGSWEAGKDGAHPGVVMLANPRVGDSYRQEYYRGEAEDMAEVLSLAESAKVPLGSYDGLIVTKDWTPLEPDVVEHKHYARGIGNVLETSVKGDAPPVELVEFTG